MEQIAGSSDLHIASPVLILSGPSPATNELTYRLRALDVKVLQAVDIDSATVIQREEEPPLVVVDMRLARCIPQVDEVLTHLRCDAEEMVALIWFDAEAADAQIMELCGFQDDHMAGSIGVDESLRRLHFLTGRLPGHREGELLTVGDLTLDTEARTVQRSGVDIDLSDTEFRLLRLLMRHARTVLPKSRILQEVWEYEFAGQANIVELYISYVRKKIEAEAPRMIHTVRGAGYVLRPAKESTSEAATSTRRRPSVA